MGLRISIDTDGHGPRRGCSCGHGGYDRHRCGCHDCLHVRHFRPRRVPMRLWTPRERLAGFLFLLGMAAVFLWTPSRRGHFETYTCVADASGGCVAGSVSWRGKVRATPDGRQGTVTLSRFDWEEWETSTLTQCTFPDRVSWSCRDGGGAYRSDGTRMVLATPGHSTVYGSSRLVDTLRRHWSGASW